MQLIQQTTKKFKTERLVWMKWKQSANVMKKTENGINERIANWFHESGCNARKNERISKFELWAIDQGIRMNDGIKEFSLR